MIQVAHKERLGRYLAAIGLAVTLSNGSAIASSPTPATSPAASLSPSTSSTTSAEFAGLHVQMGADGAIGHLVNGAGQVVRLHGADRAGSEWTCLWSNSLNDHTDQTSIAAMKAWNINAVRIPLNEDCWLGTNGVIFGGARYQAALKAYVNLLTSNGLAVILDLHWAAPGAELANGQLGMADETHAPAFWSQVAAAYASHGASDTSGNSRVIFDLFNEPFITNWSCWLNGGTCAVDYKKASYPVAGMAQLYKAVRNTGARNVVILGGLGYSSNFSQWVREVGLIPNRFNIAASWHVYSNNATYNNYQYSCPNQWNNFAGICASAAQTAASGGIPAVLSAGYPFIVGETEVSYEGYASLLTWWRAMLTWIDNQDQSYLAWDWNTVAPPELITNFNGSPTASGRAYEDHIASLN